MTTDNPALEKIRKLLRMRRGGTPDEIATALAMAQRIAPREGIDISQVDPDADPESQARPILHSLSDPKARFAIECKCAGLICSKFFHVEVLWMQTGHRQFRLVLVGTSHDIEIARYIYGFLTAEFRRQYHRMKNRVRNRQAFMWGVYGGLWTKLKRELGERSQEQVPGIVLANRSLERRERYLQQHWPDATDRNVEPDHNARLSELMGLMAGSSINIRPAVNNADTARPQLLPS